MAVRDIFFVHEVVPAQTNPTPTGAVQHWAGWLALAAVWTVVIWAVQAV